MSQFFTFKCRDQNFEDFGPQNYTEDIPAFHTQPLSYVKGGNLLSNDIHSLFRQQHEVDDFKIERYTSLSDNEEIDNKLILDLVQPGPQLYMITFLEGGATVYFKNRVWMKVKQRNTFFVYASPGECSLELQGGKNSMMCTSMNEEWYTDVADNLPYFKYIFESYYLKDYFDQASPVMFHSEELRDIINLIHNPLALPSMLDSNLQIHLNNFHISLHEEIKNAHSDGFKILIYLLENFRDPEKCSISELKKNFSVCERTLGIRFKPLFIITITSFCVELRLRETIRGILNDPEAEITSIARDAGFKNYGSYRTAHKRYFGFVRNYKLKNTAINNHFWQRFTKLN